MTELQKQQINLAIGRIFRLASRPEQAGDVAEYERCRSLILNTLDPDMETHHRLVVQQHSAAHARRHQLGAQGQWD